MGKLYQLKTVKEINKMISIAIKLWKISVFELLNSLLFSISKIWDTKNEILAVLKPNIVIIVNISCSFRKNSI